MRTLLGEGAHDWPVPDLRPGRPWVRANMVTTVDGAAQGADALSGSISTDADRVAFRELRRSADVVVVGAGTARAEGYRPADVPIVVVSGSGRLPETLADAPQGRVRLEAGGDAAALRGLVARLHDEGCARILVEGGPRLLGDFVAAGVVDELCVTVTPRLVAGTGRRIVAGEAFDVPLTLHGLAEEDGTLLFRWLVGAAVAEPDDHAGSSAATGSSHVHRPAVGSSR